MKLNPWQPLPENWQEATDDELGRWLVAAWMGAQADAAGFARGVAVPAAWAEDLIRATSELDTEVENAPLEAAIRRACKGDRGAAGCMLRDICMRDVEQIALCKLARTGAKVSAPFAFANADRADTAADQASKWQDDAVALWGTPQHRDKSASDIARLIDAKRWNAIRRKIHRPEK